MMTRKMINKLVPDDSIGSQMTAAQLERKMQELRPIMAEIIAKHKAVEARKTSARKKVSK